MDNPIKCPFILMEYINGKCLFDIWFEDGISQEQLHKRRIRSLDDIVKAMIQLLRFRFEHVGVLSIKPVFSAVLWAQCALSTTRQCKIARRMIPMIQSSYLKLISCRKQIISFSYNLTCKNCSPADLVKDYSNFLGSSLTQYLSS